MTRITSDAYYAYQIDLEQYFQHLKLAKQPSKAQSSVVAAKTREALHRISTEEIKFLPKAKFTLSSTGLSYIGTGRQKSPSCLQKKFSRRKESLDSVSSTSDCENIDIFDGGTTPLLSSKLAEQWPQKKDNPFLPEAMQMTTPYDLATSNSQ